MKAWLFLVALAGCTQSAPPSGQLDGALAMVGTERLDARTFAAIRQQRPSWAAGEVVAAWTRLELLAQAAQARHLVHEPASSTLVRRLVTAWTHDAATPVEAQPSDIAFARDEQWQRFDRGPAVIVHHAVFMKTRQSTPTFATDAMALARVLHERVQHDWGFEQFSAAAKALSLPPGIELRAEQLPGFVEDGRAIEGPSGFDPSFARHAFALENAGDFTAPFETPFGVHVVQLEQRLAPQHPTDAEVATTLQPDLIAQRVRRKQSAALSADRSVQRVVSESAELDMQRVVQAMLGQESPESP